VIADDQTCQEIHRGRLHLVQRIRAASGAQHVVKTILDDVDEVATAIDRLRSEHALLATLDLPGVVKTLGLDEQAGGPALLLQDVGIHNLKQWQKRRPLAPAQFFKLAIAITRTTAGLHARNIIHGDLNPANIVIDGDDQITLVDFETAVRVADPAPGQRPTAPGAVKVGPAPDATPCALPYAAPERTERMNRPVDHRADLYSLGITFYELLVGAPPFAGSDPMTLVHAHLARTPLPPHEANPDVPVLLSDLVLRLLAKMPEQRYQSAQGLLSDLLLAQARLQAGALAPFELGLADLAHILPLPDRLYGRLAAHERLLAAWQRAATGQRAQVLIMGEAGVGKSALMLALREAVAAGGGHLAFGKFDLRVGHTPYAPLVQALRSLLARLPADSSTSRAQLAARIGQALGSQAYVMASLLPELAGLIDLPPATPEVGPAVASDQRFLQTFVALLRALASPERPLLLCVDDLHWADEASLKLLEQIAVATDLPGLLLVATCRPLATETAEQPPVQRLLIALGAGDRGGMTLELGPLDAEDLGALCADALGCEAAAAAPLTDLLLRKTGGNPFFCRHLLRFLQQAQLLTLDPATGRWSWDLDRIEAVGVTDNVADLMVQSLARLPGSIQTALGVAACIGSKVSLGQLASAQSASWPATAESLWTAVREGLLVPVEAAADPEAPGVVFAFAHDRIQQAAYSRMEDSTRAQIHLQLGRQLARDLGAAPAGQSDPSEIFAAADQLVLGLAHVTLDADRLAIAGLLQRAAATARSTSAYGPALHYLSRAIKLLPKDVWTNAHQFAADLHRDAMLCAFVADEPAQGEALFDLALARSWSRPEKAALYVLRIDARIARDAMAEGARLTSEALRLFDLDLSAGLTPTQIAAELDEVPINLAGRSMEDVLAGPLMQSPDLLAYSQLLQRALNSTYSTQPELWPFLVARMVNLSLRHGNAPPAASGYVSYAMLLQLTRGDYATALAFGKLGIALAERLGDPTQFCRAVAVFGSVISSWSEPLQSRIPLLRQAQARGVEAGDFLFAGSLPATIVTLLFHQGVELSRVLVEIEGALGSPHLRQVESEHQLLLAYRQMVFRLSGLSPGRACIEPDGGAPGTCPHEVLRLGVAYLMRDFTEARVLSESSRRLVITPFRGLTLVEHNFYTSLTLTATCDEAPAEQRQEMLAQVATNQAQLGVWSEHAPQTYAQKHLLVEAEIARVERRALDAAELYERAIEAAANQHFLQDEALANELAGRFHRAERRPRYARQYLLRAIEGYQRWGAKAKADALEEEFLDLGPGAAFPSARSPSQTPPSNDALDHVTLLRAAEALSREVVLERLMGKLMEICFASAGAERGALILADADQLIVRATGSVSQPTTLCLVPLAAATQVPITVIERVHATLQPLVLADAARHPEFRRDGYLAAREARSVLALPILRQAKLLGVLYLENNLATRVFTPDRLQLLQLLSAQIATALENSLLFERLTQQIEERKRAEAAVRFLADAGAALSESLDYQATLNQLAQLAVPSLADWCVVDVVDGEAIRRVASSHVDPDRRSGLEAAADGEPTAGDLRQSELRRRIATVLSTRTPLLYDEPPLPVDSRPGDIAAAGLAAMGLPQMSSMILPLVARGRSVGAICLVSESSHRRFSATDLSLAQELARRAAVAIDNARLYHEVQEAVRLRDEFLSIASHELNTPIASLWLVVQGFEEAPSEPSPAALARTIQVISRQTRRLKTLVGDLLDLAHIHTGQLRLRCSDVDLGALVRDTIDRFSEDLARSRCSIDLDAQVGVTGLWDRSRLEQVVTNLLSNAIKFAPGKPIAIAVRSQGAQAQLMVQDRGIGIAAESLPLIFGRFERAVSSANYGGLGLGLYIVQEIVHAHGGAVSVQSELGAGCTFTVELPQRGGRHLPSRSERAEVPELPGGVRPGDEKTA
jgi:predicted ATPase/signal transduction histidine kinase